MRSTAEGAAADPPRFDLIQSFDLGLLLGNETLQQITEFAAALCDAPTALVSFVESDRQWFAARTGLAVEETSRDVSFCAHAMQGTDIMIVPDATADPRFSNNALVTGEPFIRFYAGAPLVFHDGVQLGALCVIDNQPRAGLTSLQRQGLHTLAANVMAMIALHKSSRLTHRELDENESKFRILADAMPQMVWSTLPDGFHDYYNARWYEFTGMAPGSTDGEAWNGMFHPEDQDRAWSVWRHSLATGEPYEIEYRLRDANGDYRWTLGRALPILNKDGAITRWFGTCTDIHDHKMIQAQREVISQELSHRIKNIFSVIGGLIGFSTRHYPEMATVATDLKERILALGRAHDFVRPHSEASRPAQRQNSLSGMLGELLAAHAEQVRIQGDDMVIDDRSATPLALLFHELATNAAKYGALSVNTGIVQILLARNGDSAHLTWTEIGGPKVTKPTSEGFGSKLIELSGARQLNGQIYREWNPAGLIVRIELPVKALHR